MNIHVGNLSPEVTSEDLRHAFERFGQVASATIIRDKVTGRSRGFGFVEMPNEAQAQAAISGLNEKTLKGQTLTVLSVSEKQAELPSSRHQRQTAATSPFE